MARKDDAPPAARLVPPAARSLTPEQQAARQRQRELTERMSTRGVPTPKSNIFGGKASTK